MYYKTIKFRSKHEKDDSSSIIFSFSESISKILSFFEMTQLIAKRLRTGQTVLNSPL